MSTNPHPVILHKGEPLVLRAAEELDRIAGER